LSRCFQFATSQTQSLFNGKVFDQIDGATMGSSLAPVLANLFLGHHENIWLKNYQGPSNLFYRRQFDDIFCDFDYENDAKLFFDFINSQHPNMKFTTEKKPTRFWLSLMCVLIIMILFLSNLQPIGKRLNGLLTNFFSYTSFSYKEGLIRTLMDGA